MKLQLDPKRSSSLKYNRPKQLTLLTTAKPEPELTHSRQSGVRSCGAAAALNLQQVVSFGAVESEEDPPQTTTAEDAPQDTPCLAAAL